MAGNLQFVGYHDLVFGPIVVDYGTKGCTTHFSVTCSTSEPLVNYYNYIIQFGACGTFHGLDFGHDGTTSAEEKRLEVSLPGLVNNIGSVINELYFDQWEMLSNENSDTIFANPLIVGSAGWMNDNDKVVLSRVAKKDENIYQAVAGVNQDLKDHILAAPASGGTGDGKYQVPTDSRSLQIYLELGKDQAQYGRPTHVLRHTSYCSDRSTYNSARSNVEKIYTPAQLLSEVSTGWTYPIPNRLYSEIAGIPFQYAPGSEASYYTWGWKKTITRSPVLANFIVEISTEYELNLWSNLRYELAV